MNDIINLEKLLPDLTLADRKTLLKDIEEAFLLRGYKLILSEKNDNEVTYTLTPTLSSNIAHILR